MSNVIRVYDLLCAENVRSLNSGFQINAASSAIYSKVNVMLFIS